MSLTRALAVTSRYISMSSPSFADTRLSIQLDPDKTGEMMDQASQMQQQMIQGVSHDKLGASSFEIPAGCQERELPTLPQQ